MKTKPDIQQTQKNLRSHEKALLFGAIFLASAAIPGVNGMPARATLDVAGEIPGMLYMMHKNEAFYLSAPQLADARTNTWTISGRPADVFAPKKDTVLFTVKATPLKQAWSLATRHAAFTPSQVIASISPKEEKRYRVTYHNATFSFMQAAGHKQAELLEVKEMPPDPPQPQRSGIPTALPGTAFRAAFSPF